MEYYVCGNNDSLSDYEVKDMNDHPPMYYAWMWKHPIVTRAPPHKAAPGSMTSPTSLRPSASAPMKSYHLLLTALQPL